MKTAALVWDLQKASVRSRTGTGTVNLLAIMSLTISALAAFLVAGGTWMFYQRWQHPEEAAASMTEFLAEDALGAWVVLAAFACAFILPALFGLTAQAAVLGASGRERRLAALRLIGLSSRDVTVMTMLETGLQAVIGIAFGFALSFLVAPVFTNLSFQDRQLELSELLLPWWGYLAVAAVLMLLALAAAFAGMQRVRVSPLGVAKREMPKALKAWRVVVFLILGAITFFALKGFNFQSGAMVAVLGMAAMTLVFLLSINLVTPFILQVVARIMGLFPGTAHFVACERVATNPRATWRRISAIAFFGFLAGFTVVSPFGDDDFSRVMEQENDVLVIFSDVVTGAMLTLGFGFVLTSMSIFLGQASEVFEQAELTCSLQFLGVPRSFQSRVALSQVMGPVLLVSLFGFAVGGLLGLQMMGSAGGELNFFARLVNAFVLLGAGWAVTIIAIVAVEPLRSSVLVHHTRKND